MNKLFLTGSTVWVNSQTTTKNLPVSMMMKFFLKLILGIC